MNLKFALIIFFTGTTFLRNDFESNIKPNLYYIYDAKYMDLYANEPVDNLDKEINDEINNDINIIEEIKVTEFTVAVTEVKQNVVDGFAIPEANTSISILNIVNSRLNLLPDNIKEVFINSGWKIIVKESRLYDDFYGSLRGITYYNEKTIYIDIRERSAKIATLHEIGHFLDNYNKTTSSSQEFKVIYESEKDKFVDLNESDTSYAISSQMEYFASVFNEVILHPESCYANTPLSYNYILNIMENTK